MRKVLVLLITITLAMSWEVNTHQALTMKALGKNSANLKGFVKKFDLYNQHYDKQIFEYIGLVVSYHTYLNYAKNGTGFTNWNIDFSNKKHYLQMIEAGSIVEDSIGRYLFHFYDPQNDGNGLKTINTDALSWAHFDGGNHYNYLDVLNYYSKSLTALSPEERLKYQAKLFVSTGMILHLLQDMFVPAHTRNDSHILKDHLELFLKSQGGFNTSEGVYSKNNNWRITDAVDTKSEIVTYNTFSEFFKKSAQTTATNFFSSDTIFYEEYQPLKYSLYKDHDVLLLSETYYYTSANGLIDPNKLSIYVEDSFINALGENKDADDYIVYSDDNDAIDNNIVIENAMNLLPKAVGASAGLIDFIFRGKMEATVSQDNTQLTINNPTNYDFSGGHIQIYYETSLTENNRYKIEDNLTIEDIPAQSSIEIDNFKDMLEAINIDHIPEDNNITLYIVFQGQIGADSGVAATKLSFIKSDGRFVSLEDTDTDKFVVLDTNTSLLWEDTDEGFLNWTNAEKYCNDLFLYQYDTWRLPTYDEMLTILNPDSTKHVYEEFKELSEKPFGYWSNETIITYEENGLWLYDYYWGWYYYTYYTPVKNAWVLSYVNASPSYWPVSYEMNVMCVTNYLD